MCCVWRAREDLMVVALPIRTDLSAAELRALARREKDPRAASRMYAIAHALEGKSRSEAARLSGMERQALHDAVVRYNAEGLAGLHDRPKGGRRPVLDETEDVALKQLVLAGPDLARHACRLNQSRTAPCRARRLPLSAIR